MIAFAYSDFDVEGFLSDLSIIIGMGTIAADIVDLAPSIKTVLGRVSTGFSLISVGIDGQQMIDNPNADTISDFVISGIGVFGVKGTVVSIGLSYTKKGVVGTATGLAIFFLWFEKWYVNYVFQRITGSNTNFVK